MDQQSKVTEAAKQNYEESTPWPEHDPWHDQTHTAIQKQVEQWLAKYTSAGMQILNAGSGGTEYKTPGDIIHMDIVERYISKFERYLVGSIENIPLPDSSIDGIICVGRPTHPLWMYSENHIRQMLNHYQFSIQKQKRFHSLSSLLYRIGMPERDAARFAKLCRIFQPISNPIAHNQILLAFKNIFPECNDRN